MKMPRFHSEEWWAITNAETRLRSAELIYLSARVEAGVASRREKKRRAKILHPGGVPSARHIDPPWL